MWAKQAQREPMWDVGLPRYINKFLTCFRVRLLEPHLLQKFLEREGEAICCWFTLYQTVLLVQVIESCARLKVIRCSYCFVCFRFVILNHFVFGFRTLTKLFDIIERSG